MRKSGLLALAMLGACGGDPHIRPLRPLEIATAPYQEVATTALTGTLMYEGGCLLFHDDIDGTLLLPVWPTGSSFNGTAVLFHHPGKADQWLMVTQEFLMQGQPLGPAALEGAVYRPVEHQCGQYPPFFVAAIRPAD